MPNQELINYIKQSLAQGYAKEQIKSTLLKEGWTEQDIEEGFRQLASGPTAPIVGENQPQAGQTLVSVDNLFKQTWGFYKSNFLKIIAIAGLPYLILLSTYFLPVTSSTVFLGKALVEKDALAILSSIWLYLILIIAYIILLIWANLALLYFIKGREENIGVIEAYKMGLKKWLSYFWVNIVIWFVILGGVILGFIPGFIMAVWVAFTVYVLIWEDKRGFSALLRSRELVRGYWWGVFGRFLLVSAISFAIVFAVSSISNLLISRSGLATNGAIIKNIISLALNILISSFAICYGYFIYQSLVRIKGLVATSAIKTWFVFTFILGIAAILLISVILFFVVFGGLGEANLRAKDAAIQIALTELRSRAEIDFGINGDYSAACVETGGAAGNSVIAYTDIAANITNNGGNGVCDEAAGSMDYVAWSKLASNPFKYWCVDSSGISMELNAEPPELSTHCPARPMRAEPAGD